MGIGCRVGAARQITGALYGCTNKAEAPDQTQILLNRIPVMVKCIMLSVYLLYLP